MGAVVEAGGDLVRASREFAAGQRFQHQRRDQPPRAMGAARRLGGEIPSRPVSTTPQIVPSAVSTASRSEPAAFLQFTRYESEFCDFPEIPRLFACAAPDKLITQITSGVGECQCRKLRVYSENHCPVPHVRLGPRLAVEDNLKSSGKLSIPLCQNCDKTLSVWTFRGCYPSESRFPKVLKSCTSVKNGWSFWSQRRFFVISRSPVQSRRVAPCLLNSPPPQRPWRS